MGGFNHPRIVRNPQEKSHLSKLVEVHIEKPCKFICFDWAAKGDCKRGSKCGYLHRRPIPSDLQHIEERETIFGDLVTIWPEYKAINVLKVSQFGNVTTREEAMATANSLRSCFAEVGYIPYISIVPSTTASTAYIFFADRLQSQFAYISCFNLLHQVNGRVRPLYLHLAKRQELEEVHSNDSNVFIHKFAGGFGHPSSLFPSGNALAPLCKPEIPGREEDVRSFNYRANINTIFPGSSSSAGSSHRPLSASHHSRSRSRERRAAGSVRKSRSPTRRSSGHPRQSSRSPRRGAAPIDYYNTPSMPPTSSHLYPSPPPISASSSYSAYPQHPSHAHSQPHHPPSSMYHPSASSSSSMAAPSAPSYGDPRLYRRSSRSLSPRRLAPAALSSAASAPPSSSIPSHSDPYYYAPPPSTIISHSSSAPMTRGGPVPSAPRHAPPPSSLPPSSFPPYGSIPPSALPPSSVTQSTSSYYQQGPSSAAHR